MSARRPQARRAAAPRRARHAPGAETLAQAALAVHEVVHQGRSSEIALEAAQARTDRAAVRAVALGTLRWYLRLAPALEPLLSRPFGELSPKLAALLVTAAHQVEYSRGAPQTQVHLAVDASRVIGETRASGMVNAVLRRFVAQRAALLAQVDTDPAARHAHPRWLVDALTQAWGERAESMLAANNQHPPMALRLDPAQLGVADFLRAWRALGREANAVEWNPDAVVLQHPAAVQVLPGFESGAVSVQDCGAQLAAPLLDARAGMRVLDACAAPGGKTLHIAQRMPDLAELVAADDDAVRLQRVRDNLERAGRQALLLAADLRRRPPSLAPRSFDRVLVDAPCSATGVIRRHPDIKLLRRPDDVSAFAASQRQILDTAFELLSPGGTLIYCTCSVLPEENERVLSAFLADQPDAQAYGWTEGAPRPPGLVERAVGWQLLPGGDAGTDGFYYARVLRRNSEGAKSR
ncbi:MAG TPA: 16S rRNA (cytosine(967)-C(5))-methyltransferase RsmB [Steroidobacteraceae bacterium]|nr:16S rRNA (cytosine(967)-C(5))-methyltransferase RsmB [Steroidobacteraceae bacterium]